MRYGERYSMGAPRWTPEDIKEMREQKLPFRCHAFTICKAWTDDPSRFISNPHQQSLGPNI